MNIELVKVYSKVLNNKSLIKDVDGHKFLVVHVGPFKNENHSFGYFDSFQSTLDGRLHSLDGPAWIDFGDGQCNIEYWIDNYQYSKDVWKIKRKQILEKANQL